MDTKTKQDMIFPPEDIINHIKDSTEKVNHPRHYNQGRYEAIDVMEDWTRNLSGPLGLNIGNALKYICRFNYKGGIEDLDKAIWYLERAKGILND